MLTNKPDATRDESALLSVHNYHESVVLDAIKQHNEAKGLARETLADIACVALNRLPPRYVRHDVDTLFYMDQTEQEALQQQVRGAVDEAFAYVKTQHKRDA